jgi:plastocyanin
MQNVRERLLAPRRRHLLAAVALAAVALGSIAMAAPTVASAEIPSIVAYNEPGVYSYHRWTPQTATILPEGVVKFSNPYATTYHGLKFTGGPAGATPNCTGIPQMASEPIGAFHWEGECTFTKPGTYTFVCTVHPLEMTGTITVTNGEPTATTEAATQLTEHEATLNGTVNPNGKATEYFFKWGTTEAYGEKTSLKPAGAGTASVAASVVLSGLAPATTYHFRLVATNEKGTVEGSDQTFTTASPPGPPSATTGLASAVSETAATLKGTVNPDGHPTEYFFEWGPSDAYGQSTPGAPAGENHLVHAAAAALTTLSPGTVYHFRLVARNTSAETATGADQTFTTLSPPPQSPPTTPQSTPQSTPPPSGSPPASVLTPPEPLLSGAPLVAGSLKLGVSPHSSSVRGSLVVGQAGAGGRLEVDLLVRGAKSRGSRSRPVRIGHLVRTSISAGRLPFSMALSSAGKRALALHRRLAVTVKVVLTPTQGKAQTITRSVTLRL